MTNLPQVVSRDEWLAARIELLDKEKEATRARDALNAQRRRLPMVRIEKEYLFDGPEAKLRLLDLFDGRRQLIVYHFMFDPDWDEGCPSCSFLVDNIGHLSLDRPVVLLVWQRCQLRLPRHHGRRGGTRRVQLRPVRRRVDRGGTGHERLPARRRPGVPHLLQLHPPWRHPARHLQLPRPPRSADRRTGSSHPAAATARSCGGCTATTSTTPSRQQRDRDHRAPAVVGWGGVASRTTVPARARGSSGRPVLSVAAFQDVVRAGRTVVTNGPWLTLDPA